MAKVEIDIPTETGDIAKSPGTVAPAKSKIDIDKPPAETPYIELDELPKSNVKQPAQYSANISESSNEIKEMQQAIIDFGNVVSEHDFASLTPGPTQQDDKQGHNLDGHNSFGNFLVNRYISQSMPEGKQFQNVKEKVPVRMEAATPDKSIRAIIATIKRIGQYSDEKKPDGNWGPRTNNALKQILGFGKALYLLKADMSSSKELDVLSRDFTPSVLESLIPNKDTDISLDEKNSRAPNIVEQIKKIKNLYLDFEKNTLNNDKYKDIIAQNKPFVSINKQPIKLSDVENSYFHKHKSAQLENVEVKNIENGKAAAVSLNDLYNLDNFKKLLQNIQLSGDVKTIKMQLDNIYNQIVKSKKDMSPGF